MFLKAKIAIEVEAEVEADEDGRIEAGYQAVFIHIRPQALPLASANLIMMIESCCPALVGLMVVQYNIVSYILQFFLRPLTLREPTQLPVTLSSAFFILFFYIYFLSHAIRC